MSIRIAEPADISDLATLGVSTFTQTFGHLYKPRDLNEFLQNNHSQRAYKKTVSDRSSMAWILEIDDAAIGYAVAGPSDLPLPDLPPNAGELKRLYLLPQVQGRGLGTQLLDTALDWLDAHYQDIFVSVYAENVGAQKLYQRFGFEKVHEYFFMVGGHADPEWIMKRTTSTQKA